MRIRIGTRRSRLAMAQAAEVAGRLEALGMRAELVPMLTSGDRGVDPASSPSGLKGLFVAEIVRALQEGRVDVAVHSAKDLPAEDPSGVVVAAVPERGDPLDVLVSRDGRVAQGSVVGTSSLRRRAQLRRSRPEVRVRDLRGNVDTRLRKLEEGEVDALVLAAAGLARLGLSPASAIPLPLEEMVPAPGQGALAVQARAGDGPVLEALGRIDHATSRAAFEAERGLTARLGGGCALPMGAYAERRAGGVRMLAVVVRPDGSDLLWAQAEAGSPEAVAEEVATTLLAAGAQAILADVRGAPA
jgi:hydroxymethylbilane synthase